MFNGLTAPHDDRFAEDARRSYTLPAPHYYDRNIYEREKEAIFYRTWQFAGHTELVRKPGDYTTCQVLDQALFVIRDRNEELRAFYNVCSHRAHQLLKGNGHADSIVCPYHAWSYHTDGRLRAARGSDTVAGFDPAEFCLKPVRVETFCGFLFVNLDPEAPSLRSQTGAMTDEFLAFAPRVEDLTFAHRLTYEIKANWKNVMENFDECYHCPTAHARLCADILEHESYRVRIHDIHHSHRSRGKPPEDSAYGINPDLTEHGSEFGAWLLWPNLAFEVYPGGVMDTFYVIPTGPESCVEHVDFYFFDKNMSEDERAAIRYRHETVQLEDVELVESVQRGLRSRGYHQGRLMVDADWTEMSEHGPHHLQMLVRRALDVRS